jgi:arylformamidase
VPTVIDISLPLHSQMPAWPGSPGLTLIATQRMEDGGAANVSRLDTDVHMGTHVDAPWHFLADGPTVETLALEDLIGQAWVAHLPGTRAVTARDLDEAGVPTGTRRLLLRTDNSELWARQETAFRPDFVALTLDAARWIVDRGIRLVGNDYLSVQRFHDGPDTHRVLLEARTVLLEGINLAGVPPGAWELICLPLRLVGADGAPARAVLRRGILPGVPAGEEA